MSDMHTDVVTTLHRHKIIAILRDIELQKVASVAQALYQGGIRLLEITFNQSEPESHKSTGSAIREIASSFSGKLLVGAGTVMTTEQCRLAADSGASYILAPNTNPQVIETAQKLGMSAIPGALTPTEIAYAHQLGAEVVKLFPASALGTAYIQSVLAAINHVPLLAVGGVHESNLCTFLKAGAVGVGVGANIANRELIAREAYSELTQLASRYVIQSTN